VELEPFSNIYQAIAQVTAVLVKRGFNCLVFLPGKWEIKTVFNLVVKADLAAEQAIELHAELEDAELDKVFAPVNFSRAILSTSFAETSITLPEVDIVLDCGRSRILHELHDILESYDVQSPKSVKIQREGRAARVKDGVAISFAVKGQDHVCPSLPVRVEDLERVVIHGHSWLFISSIRLFRLFR
jgi:ATP-dependent helicase HrpA